MYNSKAYVSSVTEVQSIFLEYIILIISNIGIYNNDYMSMHKGTTEDEMVEWHHRLDGHECEQAPEVGDGQGSWACCVPWGCKESDMTE